MSLEKDKSRLVADFVLSYIIESKMKPGDKLPSEEEFARQFGVSRVSIREGLRGLKFLGLVKSSTKRGTILQEMDFSMLSRCLGYQMAVSDFSFAQLLEARLELELGALDIICGRMTARQIAKLRSFADCSRKNDSDTERHKTHRMDCEFHRYLLSAGGNSILQSFSRLLELFFSNQSSGSYELSCLVADEHMRLTDAIESGNLELARGIMRLHLGRYNKKTGEGKNV